MQKYRCTYCEYIYDPVSGDPEHNVGRYTPFDALPGSLYPVYFQYGDATGVKLQVPVLDGGLPDYKSLVPPAILPGQG